jgi:hypothetical protein
VEQRAIAALCHDVLSVAEVAALVGDMAEEGAVVYRRRPTPAAVPTGHCWSGCWRGCTSSD